MIVYAQVADGRLPNAMVIAACRHLTNRLVRSALTVARWCRQVSRVVTVIFVTATEWNGVATFVVATNTNVSARQARYSPAARLDGD